jgi:ActR/RegA family two-component response regulator
MPRRAQNIPANETNAQRFVRVANHRVNTILTSLKAIGQLGASQYESKPEQRKKIEEAIKMATEKAMQAMAKGEPVSEFKL